MRVGHWNCRCHDCNAADEASKDDRKLHVVGDRFDIVDVLVVIAVVTVRSLHNVDSNAW